VQERTTGISGGTPTGFGTWNEAYEAYKSLYDLGLVRVDVEPGSAFDKSVRRRNVSDSAPLWAAVGCYTAADIEFADDYEARLVQGEDA
jgi:hypothetical protein